MSKYIDQLIVYLNESWYTCNMSKDETRKGSILSRKKKTILISDQEIIMFLRAYIIHPCSWDKVIDSIKENEHILPGDAKQLYETASFKKLKDRLSTKLGKMLVAPEKIQNETIRTKLRKVLQVEKSLRQTTQRKEQTQEQAQEKTPDKVVEPSEKPSQGEKRQRQEDLRDEIAISLPSEGEESQPGPSKKVKKGKKKGISVHELVKQNQLEYNKFLTKKKSKIT